MVCCLLSLSLAGRSATREAALRTWKCFRMFDKRLPEGAAKSGEIGVKWGGCMSWASHSRQRFNYNSCIRIYTTCRCLSTCSSCWRLIYDSCNDGLSPVLTNFVCFFVFKVGKGFFVRRDVLEHRWNGLCLPEVTSISLFIFENLFNNAPNNLWCPLCRRPSGTSFSSLG